MSTPDTLNQAPPTDSAWPLPPRTAGERLRARARAGLGSSVTTPAAGALLVFFGYLLGSWVGFELRFPPATTSVLWPPNALLTAALLLASPRRWWVYLLAALPAHLLIQLEMGLPSALILSFFVTNCSEALLAAGFVHGLSDAPTRFDSLRRAAVFIVGAVLLAPIISCFLDAAAVASVRGEPYWRVWQTRFYANTLTQLTLVPAVVSLFGAAAAVRRRTSSRSLEAALLTAALATVSVLVFAGPTQGPGSLPWTHATSLTLLLPPLLWAAVRFGPGGTSWGLLATALVAIGAATRESGAFMGLTAAERVLALQILLLVLGIPLFCLSAIVQERRSTELALADRLRFEALLARLSSAFVHLASDDMGTAFGTGLRQVAEFFGFTRVALLHLVSEGREVARVWTGDGETPPSETTRFLREKLLQVARADAPQPGLERWLGSPSEAEARWTGIPLTAGSQVLGGLCWVVGSPPQSDGKDEGAQRRRLVAEVFASALARKGSEDALRASEEMKTAILASLSGLTAVVDGHGRIIATNESWLRLTRERHEGFPLGVGFNYLEAIGNHPSPGVPGSPEAVAGIREVLDGSRAGFGLEYRCPGPNEERWFAMSVVPLRRLQGGAVIAHTEITERRHADIEAQRSREELAHLLRVSTVGELATALAHELNQPLTAILANAQAARMLLDGTANNASELRQILAEIVEEDKRAGDVIRRVRELLRKGERERSRVDVNVLVSDAVRLVSNAALLRKVALRLILNAEGAVVRGDRIQINQVVLNLLLNAIEAVDDGARERHVVVRTELAADRRVNVLVQDTGGGLPPGMQARVFEPFYTTKPNGMGMGLAIARSIVEAHGGAVWARNNAGGGATFAFSLPVSAEEA